LKELINSVSVKWPNGQNQFTRYEGMDVNKKYVITEGQEPVEAQLVSVKFKKDKGAAGHHHH